MLKKIGKCLATGCALIAMQGVLWAASLTATVDTPQVSLGESITLTITADADPDTDLSLPDLSVFEVSSGGTSTQMQFINGRRSYQTSTSYLLVPKRVGKHVIGSVRTVIQGVSVQSQPITVQVTQGSAQPSEEEVPHNNKNAFITGTVSSNTVYEGQGVVYTWRFYRKIHIANASVNLPAFEGFTVHDIGEQKEGRVVSNGQEYMVTEVQKLLFPVRNGTLFIEESSLQCDVMLRGQGTGDPFFDNFFGRHESKRVVFKSDGLRLQVKPLPAQAPAGFNGLVGRFQMTTTTDRTEAKTGESLILRVTITGQGNMAAVAAPVWGTLDGFKTYEDKPTSDIHAENGTLMGSKTFSVALVPLRAGVLTLPAWSLVYFDPEQKRYTTQKTTPISLQITQGSTEEPLKHVPIPQKGGTLTKQDITVENNQALLPDVALYQKPLQPHATWMGAGFALPPLCYMAAFYTLRKKHTPNRVRERNAALARARKQLKEAATHTDPQKKAHALSAIGRTYLGVCFQKPGLAFTPQDAYNLWQDEQSPALAEAWKQFLETCDAAQYGAGHITDTLFLEDVLSRSHAHWKV
jgi:hypothetical protein